MSALEEAREQAREALADFEGEVLEGQGSHAWDLADALRALLDATEPREAVKPAEDEREALANVLLDGRDADEGLSALRGYVVPCARCGQRRVIASDALNSDLEVCGRCGVDIGLHELAEQGETEWEYGYELIEPDTRDVFERDGHYISAAFAYRMAKMRIHEERHPGVPGLQYSLIQRAKAGPWLPVPGSTVRESDSGVRDPDSEESEGKA